jgi:pyridoxal 5'-phosphate synthase pdxT subunit
VILALHRSTNDNPIQILARLPCDLIPQNPVRNHDVSASANGSLKLPTLDIGKDPRTIVALRQGNHLLTTFHPELTRDDRFHEYFVHECVLGR